MPGKKKPKVSDSNNAHHRKTKNHKIKQKSDSMDYLSKNQISFFKSKYLSMVTEIFISYAKRQTSYKKVGTSIQELIAADIVLQYLEKHFMQIAFQNAICESSKDLKRKFTDIWIARKLQIRGKHDIIHGLVVAKKSNKFNIGFHGSTGSKNNSLINLNNDDLINQSQQNKKNCQKGSSDSIKLFNVRVIDHDDGYHDLQKSSDDNSQKSLKRKKKKNSPQIFQQEPEQDYTDKQKYSKGSNKKLSKNLDNIDSIPIQQKNNLRKKKKAKKDEINDFEADNFNDNSINLSYDEFRHIESKNNREKVSSFRNSHQPVLNYDYNDRNNSDNSDNINGSIDLNELPPPLGTDSSDDNGGLYGMNDQYKYNDGSDINYNKNDDFNNRLYEDKVNNQNNNFNDKYDGNNNLFDDRFKDRNGNIENIFNKKYDNKFNDKSDDLGNNYNRNEFNFEQTDNQVNSKKNSKNGKTRVKSIGGRSHSHTNNGHNSNNTKAKQKPKNNLNEISHFYTYTYEEEDEYSESTQYEYPTHIYEYEDFDEEEDNNQIGVSGNKYNKSIKDNQSNQINQNEHKFPHEDSLITGEIEIQTQEIDHLKPILAPNIKNSAENSKIIKNKVPKACTSYPSSGSPQNNSTSSNSPHEQKIKLTLQQNVEMIRNPPEGIEKKQPKPKAKAKSKSRENTQVEENDPSIIESQLVFQTFHTVDVQPDLEKQLLFKQRKGNKLKQKENGNNESQRTNYNQVHFPMQNNNTSTINNNNNKPNENHNKKLQQVDPILKNDSNEDKENVVQNPVNIHIKIVEAVIFKDSGFETNIFKVRIKLASAKEFAETRESTPSAIQQLPDLNQLIAHHLWDESFKIFCNSASNEEINVFVLALRNKKQTKQNLFDIVSTAKIALKSFVVDEISDVWINMKNIGKIHLLVCIKNFDPDEDDYDYNEEEEEEEEAEMSEDESNGLNKNGINIESDDNEEESDNQ